MSEQQNPIDLAPEAIANAYHAFKGSTKDSSIPTAQEMCDEVDTARTSQWRKESEDENRLGECIPCVTVYLRNIPHNVPDVVSEAASRYGLVKVEEEIGYRTGGFKSVTYVREEDFE